MFGMDYYIGHTGGSSGTETTLPSRPIEKAQTIGPDGIGEVPAVQVTAKDKMSHLGREIEGNGASSSSGSDGGDVMVVVSEFSEDDNTDTLNKTWRQIRDAIVAGKYVLCCGSYDYSPESPSGETWTPGNIVPLSYVSIQSNGEYCVSVNNDSFVYVTDSPDGYPVCEGED